MDMDEAYRFFMSHGIDARQASPEILAAAFKALAKKFHPDKGGNPADMKRLNCAYDIITTKGRDPAPIYDESAKREQRPGARSTAGRHGPSDAGPGPGMNTGHDTGRASPGRTGRRGQGARPARSLSSRVFRKASGLVVTFALTLLAVVGGRMIGAGLGRHDAEVLLARKSDVEQRSAPRASENPMLYSAPPQRIVARDSAEIAQAAPIVTGLISTKLDTKTYCNPRTSGRAIYNSPNYGDLNAEWLPPNELGTGWTISASNLVQTNLGNFLLGDLMTPRGGLSLKGIYAKYEDWNCTELDDLNINLVKTTSDFGVEKVVPTPVLPTKDYPVDPRPAISGRLQAYQSRYKGTDLSSEIVMPNFRGAQKPYKSYRTRIGEGFKEGANFSGSLAIITIGCGTGCRWVLAGDITNGGIHNFPLGGESAMHLGLKFNPLSSVIGASYEGENKECYMDIFNWNGTNFVSLEHNKVDRISEASCFYDGTRDNPWTD